MTDLFEWPVQSARIRKGVYAHQYKNGNVKIDGEWYIEHSITSAIAAFRAKEKLNNNL